MIKDLQRSEYKFKAKNFIIFYLAVFVCSGCASMDVYEETFVKEPPKPKVESKKQSEPKTPEIEFSKQPLSNIDHVYLGMTKDEVLSVMGDAITTGYNWNEDTRTIQPIVLKQPIQDDVITLGDDQYEAYFYWIDVKNPDGSITQNEQIPLVFEGNKLIGKGFDFLESLKRRYQ